MLSVFIPAYNEGGVLDRAVSEVLKVFDGSDFEIFIVDDSSSDDTFKVASKLAESDKRVRVVRYENGPSRRENLAASFKMARGEVIAFIDADLSAGPENLPVMARMLEGCDIVVGSRYLEGSSTRRRAFRLIFSRLATSVINLVFRAGLADYQCGLKVFRRDAILGLVVDAGYEGSFWRGFAWDTEIILRALRKGLSVREHPVVWVESDKSSVDYSRDWRMIPYFFSLWRRL